MKKFDEMGRILPMRMRATVMVHLEECRIRMGFQLVPERLRNRETFCTSDRRVSWQAVMPWYKGRNAAALSQQYGMRAADIKATRVFPTAAQKWTRVSVTLLVCVWSKGTSFSQDCGKAIPDEFWICGKSLSGIDRPQLNSLNLLVILRDPGIVEEDGGNYPARQAPSTTQQWWS